MDDYGEFEECVDCGEVVEALVGVTATRCDGCWAAFEKRRNAAWRPVPVAETGVAGCPKRDPRCAGPDAPFPCSTCQAHFDAAQVLAAGEAGQVSTEGARAELRALLPEVFA